VGALAAAVSGSGPSAFGLFTSATAARRAATAIARRFDGLVTAVEAAAPGYADPRPAGTTSASSAARLSGSGQ
jgi:4-diphosphocytidyl-2C-methyl-D-erythritol kinase